MSTKTQPPNTGTPPPKFSPTIMRACRQRLGLEPEDTRHDAEINEYKPFWAFHEKLEWEGIIGYGLAIIEWAQGAGYTVVPKD